jgi:AcrR family transcriptional regulator
MAKGYQNTAIREITDAVDVAERTFFRYFASKEDLALSFVKDGTAMFAELLSSRPRSEEPLQAIRNAFRQTMEHFAVRRGPDQSTYVPIMELINSTPALLAAQLRLTQDDDRIIRALAARENVDPDADPRPRVLSAVFGALAAMATRAWRTSGGTVSIEEAFDHYADQLGPALAGHWSVPSKLS